MKQWLTLIGYRFVTWSLALLLRFHLWLRVRDGKEDRARLPERMGNPTRSRPPGKLIWIHAASVGESLSILSLLDEILAKSDCHALVTTGTRTSAALMAQRLPERAFHQYIPLDHPIWVRRFMNYWKPDFAMFVEGELWPNLLMALRSRRVPAVLVNATLSNKSARRWRFVRSLLKRMLNSFERVLAATKEDEVRFQRLGITHAQAVGHLKFAAAPLHADDAELAKLRAAIGARPVWLAASTHKGEEEIAASIHQQLAPRIPGLLTIIAPRHPDRCAEVTNIIAAYDLSFRTRGSGSLPMADDDIFVVDTLGEMGLFFRAAPVTFLGGSLVPIGGHNVVEPMQLGSVLIVGPHMESLRDITLRLLAKNAMSQVVNPDELVLAVQKLLTDKAARDMQLAAAAVALELESKTLSHIMSEMTPVLISAGIWQEV
jgi:3-deoxy-D-manno-octulosonic-acid transferase